MNITEQEIYLIFLIALQHGLICMPTNDQIPGNVVTAALEPRPHLIIINVPSRQVRRDRSQLHERNCLPPEVIHKESTGIQTCLIKEWNSVEPYTLFTMLSKVRFSLEGEVV